MRKSEVRNRRSEIGGIVFFLIAVLCPMTSLFAQATYVPRAIKELDDARGVSLSLKFAPMWDGTKFTPRFISQSDVTDLVSDLSGKVPTSRTVNGHPLSSDVTISYGDLDGPFPTFPASMGATASNFFTSYNSASGLFTKAQPVFSDLSGTPTTLAGYGIADAVPSSRTVNGHPLSANVTVAYSELGGPFPTFPANTGATANQFFTAYADTTGLFSKAQPNIANLSDAGTLATWAGITPGTGVGTALAVNVGTSGAFVTKDGALGTPSSGIATNLTGTAASLTAGNVTTNANLTGHVTSTGNAAVLGSFTFAQLNTAISDADVPSLSGANTLTGANIISTSGAASIPSLKISGVPFAGTGTTSFPLVYINDASATASTTLNTAGTYLGVNGDGTQDLMNLLKDGTSMVKVSSTGAVVSSNITLTTPAYGFASQTNSGLAFFSNNPTIVSQGTGIFSGFNGAKDGLALRSADGQIIWSTDISALQPAGDIGLARNAAGVLEFNSGTIGTLRDWTARNGTLSGTLAVTGASTLTGGLIGGVQALSGAGAVNLTTLSTAFTSTAAANALTLANGTEGQRKSICHVAKGTLGTGILTPTTPNGYTTITFTNAGDSVELEYHATGGWCIIGSRGVTIT